MKQNNREANYDLLRIISTIAVILIHVNWRYFSLIYAQPQKNLIWISESLINIITRFSVPSFVMLSGAFILQNNQNQNFAFFYKKSLLKIFVPTFMVMILLIFLDIVINFFINKNVLYGLRGIATGAFYNLWYIYMLAGLYLLAPFLIRLKQVISWKKYKFLAISMMIWAIISQATSSQKLAYSIGVVFAFLSYFLMGDILRKEAKNTVPPPIGANLGR